MNLKQLTDLVDQQKALTMSEAQAALADLKLVLPINFLSSIAWSDLCYLRRVRNLKPEDLTTFQDVPVVWVASDIAPRVLLRDEPSITLADLMTGEFRALSSEELDVALNTIGNVPVLAWMSRFVKDLEANNPGQFTSSQKDLAALQSVNTTMNSTTLLVPRLLVTAAICAGRPLPDHIGVVPESRFNWSNRPDIKGAFDTILQSTKEDGQERVWSVPSAWNDLRNYEGRALMELVGHDPYSDPLPARLRYAGMEIIWNDSVGDVRLEPARGTEL